MEKDSFIVFNDYCINLEYISDVKVSFMIYSLRSKKIFHNTIIDSEWKKCAPHFLLRDLELIIKECVHNNNGYVIHLNETIDSVKLFFECKETIRTYKWDMVIPEKSSSDSLHIDNLFYDMKTYLKDQQSSTFYQMFCKFESNLKELFNSHPKELALIQHMISVKKEESEIDEVSNNNDLNNNDVEFVGENLSENTW